MIEQSRTLGRLAIDSARPALFFLTGILFFGIGDTAIYSTTLGAHQRSSSGDGGCALSPQDPAEKDPAQGDSEKNGSQDAAPQGSTEKAEKAKETERKDDAEEPVVRPVDDQPLPTNAADWIGRAAPDFTLKDHEGNVHRLSDYQGKIVVLEWTSFICTFVQRHYRRVTVQSLSQSSQNKGVVWLAVDSSFYPIAPPLKIKKWVEKRHIPHPILLDPEGLVGEAFAVKTTPSFLILKDGKVVYFGALDDDIWGRKKTRKNLLADALDRVLAGEKIEQPTTYTYGSAIQYLSVEKKRREERGR